MTQAITPTPGRIVWYHPAQNDGMSTLYEQPLAAIVCCVWDDRRVNLSVFDANGNSHSRKDVTLVQPGDEKPNGSYAEWMPYQLGQAAKTEAALAVADVAIASASIAVEIAQEAVAEPPAAEPVAEPVAEQVTESPAEATTTEAPQA